MLERLDLPRRGRAAGIHLLISAGVAALAAALVFLLWYPGMYRQLSGGRDLFVLLTSVDVVLGPLLTLAVFDLRKGWPHLRRDLAVIGLIQSAALSYGLHTVYVARPVAMVFEVDRFRIVSAADVHLTDLPKARPEYRQLPLTGPWLLGTRTARAGDERNEALFMGVQGIDVGQRPLFWQPYAESTADALARARPLTQLLTKRPESAAAIRSHLTELKADEATARFLPLMARKGDWVVILAADGRVVAVENVDGFF
jgi:hypothetical protein